MRIRFLIRSLVGGGAERQLIILARGLARRGHDCAILTFYAVEPIAGLRVVSLDKGHRWNLVGFLARLVMTLRRERPDILHAYLPVANVVAIAMRLLVPGLRVVLGIRASNMELRHYGLLSRISYRLEARLARFADLIIANSEAGRRYSIRSGFPERKLTVIRNGISTTEFAHDVAAGRDFRVRLGLASDDSVVGVVGRFDPMKGHALFFEALREAAVSEKRLWAVLVGEGPMWRDLHRLAVGLPVVWAGWRDDMCTVYSGLDLLCLPSAYGEGISNAVGEAMACETTCVVTDVGDSAQLVGDTGRIVPPGNARRLALAIQELAALRPEERRALGRRARQRVKTLYGEDRLVSETISALGVLDQKR
jgi:glycosyltransferase involved in cell wall biosynthesis